MIILNRSSSFDDNHQKATSATRISAVFSGQPPIAERQFNFVGDVYLTDLKLKIGEDEFSEFYAQGRKMKTAEAVTFRSAEKEREPQFAFLKAFTFLI